MSQSNTDPNVVEIIDARCRPVPGVDTSQPLPGSVVLVEGPWGTAWQRWFSDGLWHRTGGRATRTWEQMLTYARLTVVYDAERRGRKS